MSFRIRGLAPDAFVPLYGLPDAELARHAAIRVTADLPDSYPDRIGMRDAEPGETLLLVNHMHQPANSPYRSCHAVYVIEGATETWEGVDEIPPVMARRLLSLRGFDGGDRIVDGRVVAGAEAAETISSIFGDPRVRYIHAHNAGRGCYSGLIERA